MQYIEAPSDETPEHDFSLFLAGGITDCPDWQADVVAAIPSDYSITVYNPRRADFPIGDPDAALEQITWEYAKLRQADMATFWFPCETICPIVLFELGSALDRDIYPVVGVHPEYVRRQDVEIQTRLRCPDIRVYIGFAAFLGALLDGMT